MSKCSFRLIVPAQFVNRNIVLTDLAEIAKYLGLTPTVDPDAIQVRFLVLASICSAVLYVLY